MRSGLLQVLQIYGKRALQMEAGPDPYGSKYKGIWVCFMILARALGGNYVMCGVFELYGDPSLTVHTTLHPLTPLSQPRNPLLYLQILSLSNNNLQAGKIMWFQSDGSYSSNLKSSNPLNLDRARACQA